MQNHFIAIKILKKLDEFTDNIDFLENYRISKISA